MKYKNKQYKIPKDKTGFAINLRSSKARYRSLKDMGLGLAYGAAAKAGEKLVFTAADKVNAKLQELCSGINLNERNTVGSLYNGHGSGFREE